MKKCLCALFLFFSCIAHAQQKLDYRFDGFGSATKGNYTPFWMSSNTYGTVPLKPNNAYLRGNLTGSYSFSKKLKLEAEADVITAAKHTSSFWIHQLYAAVSFRNMRLLVGAKENYKSMLDKNLSMGDMTYSTNARPIPEINWAFPDYTTLPFTKGIVQFKGDFAVGKSMDNDYIFRTKNQDALYTYDILWHHKSLFLKGEDPDDRFPLSAILGLEHAVQWGGWSNYADFGKYPSSFMDFFRVMIPQGGGSQSIEGEQINALGNHLGTINMKLAYKAKTFQAALYKQHFFDDNSGLEMANWRDGIWGGELTFINQPFLRKMVLEFLQSTNQSGPMHFLHYEGHSYSRVRGGGNDDYYNNEFYAGGWSYFGRSLGNPLFASPEYNDDKTLYFKSNRLKVIHFGLQGNFSPELSYRTLFTGMHGWGTFNRPFLKQKNSFSSLIECIYKPEKYAGWQITLQFAFDKGGLYGDNFGCSLKLSKSGSIIN
jgi:hypothetical protein